MPSSSTVDNTQPNGMQETAIQDEEEGHVQESKEERKLESQEGNFKAKKTAYSQAKAAYHACMFDTTDEEEVSSHGDDEDSNKSFSDYSSEGSNAS